MAKIAIVGAGSVEFTPHIAADVSSWPELRGAFEIALHDIDPGRLDLAERAARSLVERRGGGHAVTAHADRRAALDGADYVIDTIQVGGSAATRTDFDVPARYGVRQTMGDTIGIGGISRGLRTIAIVAAMAEEMTGLCPDAWLLIYTNPLAMVVEGVWASSAWPAERTVGLCHSVRDTHWLLSELVGVPEEEIEFRTAGLNHQCFVYVFRHRETGEDLYPRLREIVDADPEGLGRRVRVELFKRFGYFPTESSEHAAEYLPWLLRHDDQVERFRIEIGEYVRWSEENVAAVDEMRRRVEAGEAPVADREIERLASEVVRALETGAAAEVYGNVRNDGLIDGLPREACVEVPVRVDGEGVHPERIGELPPACLALNRTFENVVELTVRAVVEGSRELVYRAALLDPNTAASLPPGRILDLVDELIDAHGDLIPEPIRTAPPTRR